jgi:hypothetical protein
MNENAKSATAVPVWLECSRRFRPHSMQVLQIVSVVLVAVRGGADARPIEDGD